MMAKGLDGREKAKRPLVVNCPDCDKAMSMRGLPGHRLFVHGVPRTKTEGVSPAKAEATNLDKSVRLLELVDALIDCRKRKLDVEEMDEGPIIPLLWRDEACAALRRGLALHEENLLREIKALGFTDNAEKPEKPEEADRTKESAWGSS